MVAGDLGPHECPGSNRLLPWGVDLFAKLTQIVETHRPSDIMLQPGAKIEVFKGARLEVSELDMTAEDAEQLLKATNLPDWPKNRNRPLQCGKYRFRINL